MIRAFRKNDLTAVMEIWLDVNMKTHNFISEEYWINNYAMVKGLLPQAEVYVYEEDDTQQILGFIGLIKNYISGIFVKEAAQSKGIGKQLLNYVKRIKNHLSLNVYQKNVRAVSFYQRECFFIQTEKLDADTNEKEFIMDWMKRGHDAVITDVFHG